MSEQPDIPLARQALLDITTADTIGDFAGTRDDGDGVTTLFFDTTMGGYRGWRWTVTIAHVAGLEPSVLETELTPGDDALLSPDWVPWADRMAEYRAAQEAAGEDADISDDDDDDDEDDDDLHDEDEDDLHGEDDVDGVDIDVIAESALADDGVDEADQADDDADDAGPQPPRVSRRRKRTRQEQQHDEGDQPES